MVTYGNVSDQDANLENPAEFFKNNNNNNSCLTHGNVKELHLFMWTLEEHSCPEDPGDKRGAPLRRVTWRTHSRLPAGLHTHPPLTQPQTHIHEQQKTP